MYRTMTFAAIFVVLLLVCGSGQAASEYTYEVDPIPGYIGSCCSGQAGFNVDYLATGTFSCPQGEGYPDDPNYDPNYSTAWVKFDIPDFDSASPQQRIIKVELAFEVNEWKEPNDSNVYGVKCYSVFDPLNYDNYWDSNTISSGWPLSGGVTERAQK